MEIKENQIIYNPLFNKFPVGAIEVNSDITISLNWTNKYNIWDTQLIIENDKGEIYRVIDFKDSFTFSIPVVGLYWYCFRFKDLYGIHYLVSDDSLNAYISDSHEYLWQLSIHNQLDKHPHWIKGGIIYQIMVDRFNKGDNIEPKKNIILHKNWDEMPHFLPVGEKILNNDFFGGDLRGIINKLSYLKSLNITVIYLNPIFEAASNHKYDTGNFMKIDRMFGTDEDFIELCDKAREHGIRIILDGVFNHTGDDSLYFNKYNHYPTVGAYNDKKSEFYDWYLFINHPAEYMSWWGISTLPSVNQSSSSYLKYIDGVLKKYLQIGASGYRLDVVDELMNEFVERINKVVKEEDSENIIIGEVWEDASNKVAYSVRKQYFNGKQLDSVMNYVFKEAIISYLKQNNVLGLRNVIRTLINNYPKDILDSLMNILDTHDTMRIINNFATSENLTKVEAANYRLEGSEYKRALKKMKMATILQFTLPGVPSIYYGDEAGVQGFDDPFCRQTFPWDNINIDLYEWYKNLGIIRKEAVFIDGDYEEVIAKENIFAFKRVKYNEEILVVINNSNDQFSMEVKGHDLINNIDLRYLSLPAQVGTIIRL